jgi:hypothetical protein
MRMFRAAGGRTRRLLSFLRRRARTPSTRRGELDVRTSRTLFRKRAIVYTDTADFTIRTVRDGILALLTSSATQALDARTLREVVAHRIVTLGQLSMPVHRLKLGR